MQRQQVKNNQSIILESNNNTSSHSHGVINQTKINSERPLRRQSTFESCSEAVAGDKPISQAPTEKLLTAASLSHEVLSVHE